MKRLIRFASLGIGALAAFTPIGIRNGGVAESAAACPTCCQQTGPTCVVCGTDQCITVSDHYEGKIGPGGCSATQT